ncbi:MAG: VOC family protein [Betaproteobacteria bacterium]
MQVLANIDVDDLAAAERFYCAALGLKPGRRFGRAAVELMGGTSALYLLRKEKGTAVSPATAQRRDYSRHWTPVHLDFVVEDLDAALGRAQAAGARLEGEVQTEKWGRLAAMADPFGHGFCLIQFLGRGYDEIASR